MLSVEQVDFFYGPVQALHQVSLEVGEGEIVCLLGANGAGKTTLLNMMSGLTRPQQGRVTFRGQPINGLKSSQIVAAGLAHVPEGRQLFAQLSVRDNLELGAWTRRGASSRQEIERDLEEVLELFPVLGQRAGQAAGTLSGGEQQMVAMGRGLMARPKLLLLDEPTLGLAPMVTREIFRVVSQLPARGTSVLLVEQNALGALSLAQRGYILTNGRIRFKGLAREILGDRLLREAFLGQAARQA